MLTGNFPLTAVAARISSHLGLKSTPSQVDGNSFDQVVPVPSERVRDTMRGRSMRRGCSGLNGQLSPRNFAHLPTPRNRRLAAESFHHFTVASAAPPPNPTGDPKGRHSLTGKKRGRSGMLHLGEMIFVCASPSYASKLTMQNRVRNPRYLRCNKAGDPSIIPGEDMIHVRGLTRICSKQEERMVLPGLTHTLARVFCT